MSKRSHLMSALDIGTTKTRALITEVIMEERRRPELRVLGIGQARTGGVRRDVVTNIEETTEAVQAALREAELMAGADVDRVWCTIGGDHIQAFTSIGMAAIQGEEVDTQDLDRVHEVARAVALPPDREFLHAIPQAYRVDHQDGIKDPLGMSGVRLEAEVYLVTCAAAAASNLRKAVNRAGYRAQGLVLSPLATARAVLTEDEKEVGVSLVSVGASTVEIVAFDQGQIQHIGVLPIGGDTITGDLVRGLSIPFAEAQRIKERHGVALAQLVDPRETLEVPGPGPGQRREVARELIAHIVEQRLDEIFGMVHNHLESKGLLNRLGAGLVLSGGTCAMEGALEMAHQCFAAPIRLGYPGEGLSGLNNEWARPRFSTVAGACLMGTDRFQKTGEGTSTAASQLITRLGAWIREFF